LSQVILYDFRYLDFNWALIFENWSSTILAVLIQAGFMIVFRVLWRVFLSILYLIAPVRCAEFAHDKLHYIDFVTTAFGMVWVKLWAARRARKVDAQISCIQIELVPNVKVLFFVDLEMLVK
jgi:hypothetical protein